MARGCGCVWGRGGALWGRDKRASPHVQCPPHSSGLLSCCRLPPLPGVPRDRPRLHVREGGREAGRAGGREGAAASLPLAQRAHTRTRTCTCTHACMHDSPLGATQPVDRSSNQPLHPTHRAAPTHTHTHTHITHLSPSLTHWPACLPARSYLPVLELSAEQRAGAEAAAAAHRRGCALGDPPLTAYSELELKGAVLRT